MSILDDYTVQRLNNKLKTQPVKEQIDLIQANQPHQIAALQHIATKIKGTELEGLPFTIALMKTKLLPDKAIATELNIPLKAVRKFSQVDGFQTLLTQMAPAVWSDLILAAQATLMHHISVEKDLDASKWLLESLGQVASSKPLTNNTNQTLILNGQPAGGGINQSGGVPSLTVESLAEAMFNRLTDNQKVSNCKEPPILLSSND